MISAETDFEPAANGPFEGPEKLLEIWFAPSAADCLDATSSTDGKFGLRRVPRVVWEEMLDIVKCKILSVVEGTETDAYLLRCVPSVPNARPLVVMYSVACYLADRMHYQRDACGALRVMAASRLVGSHHESDCSRAWWPSIPERSGTC